MKKFELTIGVLVLISTILVFLQILGGTLLAVLTFCTLSLFYYLSFALFNDIRFLDIFKSESYKNTNARKIIGAVILGFALSAIIMGALFKIQIWPGGAFQLLIGLILTGIVLIVATVFYIRDKNEYFRRIFKRIAIIGGLGLILYLVPTNTLVDIYYGDNPDYADLYKKVLAAPDNHELREQLENKRQEIYGTDFSE